MQTTATARIPSSYACLERSGERVQVGGAQDGAVGGDPLVDLDDPLVQQLGQYDAAGEDARAGSGRRCAGRRGSRG